MNNKTECRPVPGRNGFIINLHGSYVAELGFELATPGSTVRRTIDCAVEPGFELGYLHNIFRGFSPIKYHI